jgi:uncharacterized membrane protein YccF (DUF307 family)
MPSGIMVRPQGPNLLLRFVYFVLVGWWVGALVSAVAWFLVVTIIGLPLGLWVINRLPTIITLRPQGDAWVVQGHAIVRQGMPQRSFWLRALYFLLIGWWLAGLWMAAAYVAVVTVILLPLAFWMYGRIGAVTTLYRS